MTQLNRRQFLAGSAASALAAGIGRTAAAQSKPYRGCVIGDTKNGGYGHGLHMLWARRDDIDTVALADPDPDGRKKHAEESGAQRTYADYREMLTKEKPDFVAIGPRTTVNHREYLLACAEAGAHGMIEKPFTPDLAQADEIIGAIDAKNLKWAIGFNFRANPVILHLRKQLVEAGLIGDILEYRLRGKMDRRSGGEDLIVLGIHVFDLLRFFGGDPQWCMANVSEDGRPATKADVREATEPLGPIIGNRIHCTFGMPGDIPAYFSSLQTKESMSQAWGIDIYGTDGIVTVRMAGVPEINLWRTRSWAHGRGLSNWEPIPDAPHVEFPPGPGGYYDPVIADLVSAVKNDHEVAVSLHHGRAATEMIQAVWESQVQGGRVRMPLQERSHPLTRWE
jgi:predicted dehydrogenase